MKKSRSVPPYTADGRTAFPLRHRTGVYLIRRNGQLIYVGHSASDVYKALFRHFQRWTDNSRAASRITYVHLAGIRVRVIYTRTAKQARDLERALILRYKPRDNADKFRQWELDASDRALMKQASDAPEFTEQGPAPF